MSIIEIFRAGAHVAMSGTRHTFTEQDLEVCARAYSPQSRLAPLVLGHPDQETETYGTVSRLFRRGKSLFADCNHVSERLKDWVRQGRYKKISASFFMPGSPHNPRAGQLYLKHVGFLGAMPPAIKGMLDPAFSETEHKIFSFGNDICCLPARFHEEPDDLANPGHADIARRARIYHAEMAEMGARVSFSEAVEAVTGHNHATLSDADIAFKARVYRDRMAAQGKYISFTEAVEVVNTDKP